MKKVALILGGRGLIGSEIAKKLYKKQCHVHIVDKQPPKTPNQHFEFTQVDIIEHGRLANLIKQTNPDVVINCINIATVFSQLGSDGYPAIIAFYLNIYHCLTKLQKSFHYIQIGTTGSGGLGFHIPFTHGEMIENLPIINKAAFAGITTAMLTLLSRSFNNDGRVSEIKPGLAVFSDTIIQQLLKKGKLVALDGGESGLYTYNEVALLTSYMGFSTASLIADKTIDVLFNRRSARVINQKPDIIASINQSIINQDSEDLRKKRVLLNNMKRLSINSVIATGNLGPPDVTRDLILAFSIINAKNSLINSLNLSEIQLTLKYIKRTNKKLSNYLLDELSEENFKNLLRYYIKQTEPWQIVKDRL